MVGLIRPYTDTAHGQVRALQISSLDCGKPWTKGDGDNIEEPNQCCEEIKGDQKTGKMGVLETGTRQASGVQSQGRLATR